MAEPVSLASGALGIASAFNTCLSYFKYVQIGIHASLDFETTAVELNVLWLRFTRWGEAAQVENPNLSLPEPETRLLQQLLNQIRVIFERAKKTSDQCRPNTQDGKSAVYDTKRDLKAKPQRLCSLLSKISTNRKLGPSKSMPVIRKLSWALYTKDHLNELVADVCRLVDQLENVFPTETLRKHLCESELRQLEASSLKLLKEVIESHDSLDPTLNAVVARTTDGGNIYRGNNVRGGGRMHNGNFGATSLPATSRNNTYVQNSAIGKDAILHNGDSYGGKSIWDN